MAEIRPFRGYIYNPDRIGEFSNVIAPPWDVIDAEAEKYLRALSPWNIINLISGNADPAEAKELFDRWMEEGVLVRDKEEFFYFARHRFGWMGKTFVRKGIFALLRLEDFGSGEVIPHEKVFEKYHTNRYRLIEKCKANFSPVFMLYSDDSRRIEKIIETSPVATRGKTRDKDSFDFGRIEEKRNIASIREVLSQGKIIIADGHHRYQAALRYYRDNPVPENSFVLVFLVNIEAPEVLILPTHRYVASDVSFTGNISLFEKYFDVEPIPSSETVFEKLRETEDSGVMGVYEKGRFFIIRLKEKDEVRKCTGENISDRWLSLDTVILHNFILEKILNTDTNGLLYHQSAEYLLNEYRRRNIGVIFFLRPVAKRQFAEICLNGELMPQKTTYFYPKVPSGLVINKF